MLLYTILKDGTEISTVWIGSNYGEADPPLIFETMVFSKDGETLSQRRYSTESEALAGHEEAVKDHSEHE